MNIALNVLRILLLISLILLCGWSLQMVRHATLLIDHTDTLIARAEVDQQAVEGEVERDFPLWRAEAKQYDTDAHRLMRVLGASAIGLQKSSSALQKVSEGQVQLLTANSEKFGQLLDASKEAVTKIGNSTGELPDAIRQAKLDMADFDAEIKNPAISGSLQETQGILVEAHGAMKDVRKKADALVAPPTKLDAVKDWLVFAARMFYFSKP